MKTLTTLVLSAFTLLLSLCADAQQLKIISHDGDEDLQGTVVSTNEFPFGDNFMDIGLKVINESDETVTLRCRRTELDVVPLTEHGVCWNFCPTPDLIAGQFPVYIVNTEQQGQLSETIAPGDTVTSFSMHYVPQGMSGVSNFMIEFIDESETLWGEIELEFDASVLSIEDLTRNLEMTLAPNPASEYMNLTLEGVDMPVTVVVSDLLGQQVSEVDLIPTANQLERINTADMRNGVYFLSILAEGQVIRTSKFIVSH